MRKVLVVTVGRSDYGIYRQVLERLVRSSCLEYELLVSGAHLSHRGGYTVEEIRADRHPIAAEVPLPDTGNSPHDMSAAMAAAMAGTAAQLSRSRPDLLLTLGDRFEMFAIAAASVPFNIPIGHIHGGELSFGAIDEVFRHAITKMAHLHFPATREYGNRLIQMGEEPWRVTVSGAPGLDNLRLAELPSRSALEEKIGFTLGAGPILVTLHPVSRKPDITEQEIGSLLTILNAVNSQIVFTAPNADSGSSTIRARMHEFCQLHQNSSFVENLGSLNYLAMMREASAVIGNSSSALIEAPSFELPAVNIGSRQDGRTRAANIIDVGSRADEIGSGLARALDPEFRLSLKGLVNPYGDGHAAERIVGTLEAAAWGESLIMKRFFDVQDWNKSITDSMTKS